MGLAVLSLYGRMAGMDILGGVVLLSPEGAEYAAGTPSGDSAVQGIGVLGGIVLIDPDTGEPYTIGA